MNPPPVASGNTASYTLDFTGMGLESLTVLPFDARDMARVPNPTMLFATGAALRPMPVSSRGASIDVILGPQF